MIESKNLRRAINAHFMYYLEYKHPIIYTTRNIFARGCFLYIILDYVKYIASVSYKKILSRQDKTFD